MLKPLLLLAVTANVFFIVSSTEDEHYSDESDSKDWYDDSDYNDHHGDDHHGDYHHRDDHHGDKCRANEVYVRCPVTVCRPKYCSDVGRPVPCVDLPQDGKCPVKPGCICKEGYVWDDRGICIPINKCRNICTKPNEVYDECIVPCPPRRCDVDERLIKCAPPPKPGDPLCVSGCRCADSYYTNDKGICVTRDQCPKCKNPNEIFDPCPPQCPAQRCDVDPAVVLCPVPPQPGDPDCEPGCRCIDGYVRNNTGVCIPRDRCPKCPRPHEVYDPCPPPCPPQTCESLDRTYHCPRHDPASAKCKGQCRCEPGHYRNKIGECISKKDCLKCMGPHEYFSCDGACDNVCATMKKQNKTNCPIKNIKCTEMCYCEDGFARDHNNICIPIKDCKAPRCGRNERYEECPAHLCQPQNCSQLGYPIPCPELPKGVGCPGGPGCVCVDGYLRNKNGVCVPKLECPTCAGDPNKQAGCGVYCNSRCSDIGQEPRMCIQVCYDNACDCKKGHYLDDKTGKCVLPKQCTKGCGKNEVYSDCVNGGCQAKNCSQAGYPVPCVKPKICIKGCLCKDGYLRNSYGVCIPREQCPSCGGDPNAHPGCGVNCGRRCSNYNKGSVACPAVCDLNGCDCNEGHVFDDNTRKCVLPKHCTPTCNKPHEVYDPCPNDCPPHTCESLDRAYACERPDSEIRPCKGGCRCAKGYFRNVNGDCVTEEYCRKCPGPHEFYACDGACDNVCKTIHKQNRTNCPIVNIKCTEMCYCQDGFARAKNNTCIPIDCCDKYAPKCGVNERYEESLSTLCEPIYCSDLGYDIDCPDPHYPDRPACVCIHGYVRDDKNGVCIPKERCPSCAGDPNKVAGCGVYCNTRCSNIGQEPEACILLCYPNGCECRDGYYLDEVTGNCVRPEHCTSVCGKNEVYSDCVNGGCQAKNCSQAGYPVPCVDPKKCMKGCLCKDGYLRNGKGVCIPRENCPSCGGDPNAHPGCGVNCGKHCSDYLGKPLPCPKICHVDGCDCNKDYYYDDNIKKCVLPKYCTPLCGDNEMYSECVNGGCQARNCSQLGKPIRCVKIDPKYCIKGCVCKEGYLRADNGICVPEEECKLQCREPHEVYDPCPPNCPPQTCESIGRIYDCPLQPADHSHAHCKPACRCEKGYYRNKIGECISKEDCLKCTGPHEYFSCGGACDNVCATLHQQNQTNCPIRNIVCNKMCYCEKDYARAKNNTCIPISKCPAPVCGKHEVPSDCVNGGCDKRNCSQLGQPDICIDPERCIKGCICADGYLRDCEGVCVPIKECPPVCGKHEVYNNCIQGQCNPKNCSQLGFPVPCPRIDPKYCIKGCLCKEGYVRDKYGICIPKNRCPSCGGDPNAEAGCGVNCNRHCRDIGKTPGVCNDLCKENGCDCKVGFFFDDNTGRCVLPKHCTPVCDKYEVYTDCIEDEHRPLNCSQLGYPLPNHDPDWCTDGCICKEGYARAKNGNCIPVKQCPSCRGDPNAEAGCGTNCNKHCSDIGKRPRPCTLECRINGCDCKEKYYLDDKTGKCVLPKQCSNCEASTSPTTITTPAPSTGVQDALDRLRKGNIIATGEILYQLIEIQPGVSFVSSTISMFIPFAQLAVYAVGLTLEQLLRLLNLKNTDEIKAVFPILIKNYKAQLNVTFELVCKFYGNDKYQFSSQFITDAENYFDAEGENINFGNPIEAADTINKWVENKTHEEIKDLVEPDLFSGDTRLVLINAIYFQSNWLYPFNPNLTQSKDFYVTPNKTISIPTMYQQGSFSYGESDYLDAQLLEMKYESGNFSFMIWLPRQKAGLLDMVKKLRDDPEQFYNSLNILTPQTVQVSLPVMDILTDIDLAEITKKANNVTEMFNSLSDGFKGILKNDEPVYVSAAKQKAKIKVDEKGTKAAVATAVIVTTTSAMFPPPDVKSFIGDHPYLFSILLGNDPVFAGAFFG